MFEAMRSDADVVANEEGIARIRNLPKGKATVTATARGHAGARVTVDVVGDEGTEHKVELHLRRAAPVSGRVLDAEGKPISSALVQVVGEGEGDEWIPASSERTDSGGRFELADLPEKPVNLRVSRKGHVAKQVAVAGAREGVEVRLEPQDPAKARRKKEVVEEMSTLWQRMQDAKDENERQALQQRAAELSQELGALGGDGFDDEDEAATVVEGD
jgi:hypothetical protein